MRYFQRSIKYFLALCVVYAAMLYLFSFGCDIQVSMLDKVEALMSTSRGSLLIAAIIGLSAAYPFFGFTKREIDGDLVRNREQIILTCEVQHFRIDHESQGRMTFVAESLFKRVTMLFEDHIKIVQSGDGRITVSGNRKAVAYLVYRLEYAIDSAQSETEE